MTLDYLTDHYLRPSQQKRTTALARIDRRTKGFLPGADIACQTVSDQQDRSEKGAGFDSGRQRIDEVLIAMHREHPA
jgi:hypothetical protein